MQPTHENIDRWLFDYTEGNLSAEQEQQLELFLMNHPDLEVDMDAWEMSKVDVSPFVF
jgi:anti-sigma factor RsiW